MPWMIAPQHPDYAARPAECPGCHGAPPDSGRGSGQCAVCGAILVSPDPGPGEVFRLTLIPCDEERHPLPRRRRRSIEIEWGERMQADGTTARVYRVIDKQHDRYIETVTRADGSVVRRDEPLSEHRGHGSARRRTVSDPSVRRRQWIAM